MKRSRPASLACLLLTVALVGCGGSDLKKPATGGTGGDGTGGNTGTGGITSTGGNTGTGGITSTGGNTGSGGMSTGGTGGSDLPDAAPDTLPEAGPDMGPACVAGASCALAGGGKGVCKNNACSACLEPADDALCNAAYGPGNI